MVTLVGEHDAFGAETLRRELDHLLDEGRAIVVDLGEATFIDSATVGVLLNTFRRGKDAGVELELVLPETSGYYVRRLIETTQLDTVFPIFESLDDALDAARHH